jgi:hypothetical protein
VGCGAQNWGAAVHAELVRQKQSLGRQEGEEGMRNRKKRMEGREEGRKEGRDQGREGGRKEISDIHVLDSRTSDGVAILSLSPMLASVVGFAECFPALHFVKICLPRNKINATMLS